MPFQRFAHHLRGEPRFEIAQTLDLVFPVTQLHLVLLPHRLELEFLLHLRRAEFTTQPVALTFDLAHLLGDLELLRGLHIVELRLQLLDPHVLLGRRFRLLGLQIRLGQLPLRFGIRFQPFHLVAELVAFLLHIAHRFGHREFLTVFECRQLCFEFTNLGVLARLRLLQLAVRLLPCELNRLRLVVFGQLQA